MEGNLLLEAISIATWVATLLRVHGFMLAVRPSREAPVQGLLGLAHGIRVGVHHHLLTGEVVLYALD